MSAPTRRTATALLLSSCVAQIARAQDRASDSAKAGGRSLPADVVTQHRMALGPDGLSFRARAGALSLQDATDPANSAEVAFIAFEADAPNAAQRPVTFVINGGPGAASAWLGLGAVSPWRINMDGAADLPSAAPRLVDNAETWLPFTDLVLIDTPGTGYSTAAVPAKGRSPFYTVDGDIDGLAVFIRQWLTAYGRMASPKYIVAESYGGIRAPRLAHILAQRENVGVRGLLLVSPLLDVSVIEGESPLVDVARLPSYAAIQRGAQSRSALADVESYAEGEYLTDLLKGPRNAEAQTRLASHVAAITGLDARVVRQLGSRVDRPVFVRERTRASGKVLSIYDGTTTGWDPNPADYFSRWDDPMLDALRAPLGAAMTTLVSDTLHWPVGTGLYQVLNYSLVRRWDWGTAGRAALQSTDAMRSCLASDPEFRVTIAHGLYDLVTPYLGTQMVLDQLPAFGAEPRIKLVTYPAGHMVYSRDAGRTGLRDEARALIARRTG